MFSQCWARLDYKKTIAKGSYMALSWEAVITGAISGGAIGALASLIAPWSQWGVEKKRLLTESRRSRVKAWRTAVIGAQVSSGIEGRPFREKFSADINYRDLRPFLSQDLASEIETPWPDNMVETESEMRDLILDEICQIERRWGLI